MVTYKQAMDSIDVGGFIAHNFMDKVLYYKKINNEGDTVFNSNGWFLTETDKESSTFYIHEDDKEKI